MKTKTIFILLCFICCSYCFSQTNTNSLDPYKKLSQYCIDSWTIENGLPTNSLVNILQTKDGYIWITSYNGLIRFDGTRFRLFNKNNSPVLQTNTFLNIAEGKDGTLWINSFGNGFVSYQNNEFKLHGLDENFENLNVSFIIDKDNRIWSGYKQKGIFVFENGNFEFVSKNEIIANVTINDLEQDSLSALWFGTGGKGLIRYYDGKYELFYNRTGIIGQSYKCIVY